MVAGTQLDPAGATSIGAGIVAGKAALDSAPVTSPPWAVKAMLVVTDGVENTAPMIASVSSSLTANTFAIGLGTPANISVASLDQLTQGLGGYMVVTGAITTDQTFRLTKYFLQALAGITNAQVVVDPQGELVWGAEYRVPFSIVEPDVGADVILLCPAAHAVDMRLQTPGGQIITPATASSEPALQYVAHPDVAFYRMSLPALQAQPTTSRGGQWTAILRLGKEGNDKVIREKALNARRAIPFSVIVHAYSALRLQASVLQQSREPGARVAVHAWLTEYDVPVERRATAWAEVTRPDGVSMVLKLTESEGGLFSGVLVTALAGLYTLRVRATGSTFNGRRFEREQTLTATAVPGADRPAPATDPGLIDWLHDRDERLCRLLACLLDEHALGRVLAEHHVDPKALRRCLDQFCRPARHHAAGEGAHSAKVQPLTHEDLHRAVAELTRVASSGAVATLPTPAPAVAPATLRLPSMHTGHGASGSKVMFGLSPEDKAAQDKPGEDHDHERDHQHGHDHEREHQHAGAEADVHAHAPPTGPRHGLSADDKGEDKK